MSTKKFKFFVFNVKLQTEKKGEERIQAYEDLFKALTARNRNSKLKKNEAIRMYRPFERNIDGIKYFYGGLSKGISFFDRDEIRVMEDDNLSKETVNKNKIFDPTIGDYLFIPSIHRFALLNKPKSITVNDFMKFLNDHLPKFVKAPDKIEIDFERESSIIDEIFKARAVYSLSYEISYTNNDALSSQGQLFDSILKENNVGKLSLIAQSDMSEEGMKIKQVDFLGGGLEVAKNNGVIKSAVIKPLSSNKKIKVSNVEKPKILEFTADENDIQDKNWFKKLISIYKSS